MWIPVAVGGMLGTLARFSLQQLVPTRAPVAFPLMTLLINISGSMVLGLVMGYALAGGGSGSRAEAAVAIGFCGAFTTMSAFAFETLTLLQSGQWARAGVYAGTTMVGSIAAAALGIMVSQRLL